MTSSVTRVGRCPPVLASLVVVLAGCAAAAPFVIPAGIEFARNLLVTASNNYGSRHSEDVSRLITRLTQPYVNLAGPPPAIPGSAAGYPAGAAPYPGGAAPYPGQQGVPTASGAQPYPGSPTASYPGANPYPGQPASGYPGQAPSGYPSQAPSGYPSQPPSGYPTPAYPASPTPQGYPQGYPPPPVAQQPPTYPTPPQASPQYPQYPSYPSPQQPPAPSAAYPGQAPSGTGYSPYPVYAPGALPRGVSAEPIMVDVALVRQTPDRRVVLMNDGESLRGDPSSPEKGDKFKLVIRTNCDCYAYLVTVDGSGWAQGIFPGRSSYTNPLRADQEYAFPEGPNWYALDQVTGVETFYIVVWPQPRPDLEESIAKVAGNERPRGRGAESVSSPAIIPGGFARTAAGHGPTVRSESGQPAQVTPLTYVAKAPGEGVTVTRWFRHE